jgi:acetyl-CoA acetyltransferase
VIAPDAALRNRCAIAGAGNSRLGQVPGISSLDLLAEAIANALEDAGLQTTDVDGLITRGPDDAYCHHQQIGERLGIDARFSTSLDNGGASQILGVALAVVVINAGLATTVVCGYGRNAWSRTHSSAAARVKNQTRPDDQHNQEFGPEYGYFGAVAAHAFGAQRHMHEFGTTRQDFAEIAMAFRDHATCNPAAQMRKPLSREDYFHAREIVSPFGLFDCSLRSDAAGAVIVTSAERAHDLKARPVLIRGFGSHNNLTGWFSGDHMIRTAAIQSGEAAYRMAGIAPAEVNTVQLYDCFTYMVLVQLEDYGFCQKGEGGAFVRSGALRLGGRLPANTSGGQLSEAHVEGMLQIVEGVRQLRGEYPAARQVADAEIALISGHGGNQVCHSTLILQRA